MIRFTLGLIVQTGEEADDGPVCCEPSGGAHRQAPHAAGGGPHAVRRGAAPGAVLKLLQTLLVWQPKLWLHLAQLSNPQMIWLPIAAQGQVSTKLVVE